MSIPARQLNPSAARADSTARAGWLLAAWNEQEAEVVPVIDPPSALDWKRILRARRPVVMRGFAAEWAATRWTFEELAARIGARPVPVVRVHDGLLGYRKHEGMDYEHRPFDEFARHVAGGGSEWFLQLKPDEDLPELVRDLEVPVYSITAGWRDRRITIGGPGTTTPIHRELPDNIFSMFCGEKEVALFAPAESRRLYAYGPFSGVPHLSRVDPRCADWDRYPRLRRTKPFHCRVRAGDALLIPRGWWHTVRTIEPSIALGSWWAVGVWSLLPRAAQAYKRVFGIRT
jgi:hypothetical protein